MKNNNLDKYIGEPCEEVVKQLEKQGYKCSVVECSKPKIKTDAKLTINVKINGSCASIIVGDFLIDKKD